MRNAIIPESGLLTMGAGYTFPLDQGERKLAKDDANKAGSAAVIEKGLGVLERVWDAHWALRLACAILFLDMAMMLRVGRGLRQWTVEDKALLSDVGWVAPLIVAFSFTVAIVIPLVLIVLRQVSALVLEWFLPFLTKSSELRYRRPLGYVPAGEFYNFALCGKDDFLFRMYEAHERKKKTEQQARERAGELTAATLLAVLTNWLLAQWTPGSIGLIGAIADALADWASVVAVAALLYSGSVLKWAWFSDASPNLIYYPSLDQSLRDRKERTEGFLDNKLSDLESAVGGHGYGSGGDQLVRQRHFDAITVLAQNVKPGFGHVARSALRDHDHFGHQAGQVICEKPA
jgi:hypothetical protein